MSQVLVSGVEAEFELHNYLEQVVPPEEFHHMSLETYNTYYRAALNATDEGELIIYPNETASQRELIKG